MRYIFIAFLLLFTASSYSQELDKADKLLTEMTKDKGIVGITAGFSINGQTEWSNSSGYSCLDSSTPFTTNTLTRIASIAKPMTAIAIMQLVEQNLIELDKPISNYLPNFPKKEKGEVTTRQFLSHTSGISQYFNTKEIENTVHFSNLKDAMNVFADRPLLFEPGSNYFYTSYGYVVLGRIIEEVSGKTYEEYMKNNIWDKANMKNTGVEDINETYDSKSCLYHKKKKKPKEAKQNDLSNRIPAGGFYSTLQDMLNFGNALLEGKLIKASTLELMLQNQFEQKEGNQYGLGWFFYAPKPNDNLVIGHSGEQTGCASQLMIIPNSNTIVVVLSNTSGTWKDVVTLSSELIQLSEQIKN